MAPPSSGPQVSARAAHWRASVAPAAGSGDPRRATAQQGCCPRICWPTPKGSPRSFRITGGNFRLPEGLLTQVRRILERNGLGVVTRAVVEAAREVLVIGTA
jgi:hypothetical protein